MAAEGGAQEVEKQTGTVKWFSYTRGYGFIVAEDQDATEYFVHQSNIIMEGFRSLRLGEKVEFRVSDTEGRIKAIEVTGPGGVPPLGAPPRKPRGEGSGHSSPGPEGSPVAHVQDSAPSAGRAQGRGGRGRSSGRSRGRGGRGRGRRGGPDNEGPHYATS